MDEGLSLLRDRRRAARRRPGRNEDQRRLTDYSTRTVRLSGEELLIVVGEGHEVGHVFGHRGAVGAPRDWAREPFGVSDFRYHWSA